MRQKIKEITQDSVAQDECQHYWIIEIANGPKSRGECKYCGKTRYFLNAMPDFNQMKRNKNPLNLPQMPDVELDEDSRS